LLISMD